MLRHTLQGGSTVRLPSAPTPRRSVVSPICPRRALPEPPSTPRRHTPQRPHRPPRAPALSCRCLPSPLASPAGNAAEAEPTRCVRPLGPPGRSGTGEGSLGPSVAGGWFSPGTDTGCTPTPLTCLRTPDAGKARLFSHRERRFRIGAENIDKLPIDLQGGIGVPTLRERLHQPPLRSLPPGIQAHRALIVADCLWESLPCRQSSISQRLQRLQTTLLPHDTFLKRPLPVDSPPCSGPR